MFNFQFQNCRLNNNDGKDIRLTSPSGHATQRLMSPALRVVSLNDHRVSSPSDSDIRVHSPSKNMRFYVERAPFYSFDFEISFIRLTFPILRLLDIL